MYWATRLITCGKVSPSTLLFGFFIFRSLSATSSTARSGGGWLKVGGISLVTPWYSWLMVLKWVARFSATSSSPSLGKRSLGSKFFGFSLEFMLSHSCGIISWHLVRVVPSSDCPSRPWPSSLSSLRLYASFASIFRTFPPCRILFFSS